MTKAFDYMFSKKSLPVIALLLCAGLIVGFKSLGWGGGKPPSKYEKILHNIGEMLSQIHYSPKKIDDNFSKEIFKKYLSEKIDQQKNIFLQSDIAQLKKYETKLDDEILGGPVEFVPAVSEVYKKTNSRIRTIL
jgi:carboxyl-terminal processing protease